MVSVIRGLLIILSFGLSFSLGSDLDTQWQNALKSSSSEQPEQWQSWIATAKSQNIESAEAYFNLARSKWENHEIASSVQSLLVATQARNSVFQAWRDLRLLSHIQQSLLNQSRPSPNLNFQLLILKGTHLKWIWLFCLSWLALITLFLRFGLRHKLFFYKLSAGLWFIIFLLGVSVDWLTNAPFPFLILDNGQGAIPVYSSPNSNQDKLTDLPTGLVVMASKKQEGWIFTREPVEGWFEERLSLAVPTSPKSEENFFPSAQDFSNTD